MSDKKADLAGPGVGDYQSVAAVLPADYRSPLDRRETQQAIFALRREIEDKLCAALDLIMVQVPLIVSEQSGLNDMLDRDGSRTPVSFDCGLGLETPIRAQVVQAATKWKRMALAQFGCERGQGVCTDMRAIRKDYFLDHDHSAYVDQWDWERAIGAGERSLATLRSTVEAIWEVIVGAEALAHRMFPKLAELDVPRLPERLTFIHAEEILERFPDLPRKQRETAILAEHPAVFIVGIGWPLADGLPHELRAADYDDWCTEVTHPDGRVTHGLNGDILVWNPVTRRRHELSSMGVRVTADTLRQQLAISGQLELLEMPYHSAIVEGRIPLSIGGGIGQSRTLMLLLRKAHLGEVSVSVWPDELKAICAEREIYVLE